MAQEHLNLKEAAKKVADTVIDNLVKPAREKEINFVEAKGTIVRIVDWARRLEEADVEGIPENQIPKLKSVFLEIEKLFDLIEGFGAGDGTAKRDTLSQQLDASWATLFNEYSTVKASLFNSDAAFDNARKEIDRLKQQITESSAEVEAAKAQAMQSAADAASAAMQTGVASNWMAFDAAKNLDEASARRWLRAVITTGAFISVLLMVNLVFGYMFLIGTSIRPDHYKLWLIGNGIVTAALIAILSMLVKHYRSHLNSAKNREETALALQSYQAISQGASTEMRDAVVIGVANLVYSHKSSGFASEKESLAPDISTIVGHILKAKGNSATH